MEQFWKNNNRARALFDDLAARMDRGAYDDDFLARLAAYREAGGSAVNADVFAARYLLAQGDPAGAAACGERACRRRSVNHAVRDVLADAYMALGRYDEALIMQGYCENIYGISISLDVPPDVLTRKTLDRLSVAMGFSNYAPFAACRMTYDAGRGLAGDPGLFAEEFLPVSAHIGPGYYVGAYADHESIAAKAWLLGAVRRDPGAAANGGGDFTFDIIRGERAPGKAQVSLDRGLTAVLPVIGTEPKQEIRFETSAVNAATWLDQAAPSFFRLDESAALSSDSDFIVGMPIHIGHRPDRHRLVLNILADALAWNVLRDRFAAEMPNTHRFFSRGLIFDSHFAVVEYTYPSLPTIETGMYPHHSQIFNQFIPIELPADYVTLSERMRARGYATANLMGDGVGIYNGVTRGYDRLIVAPYRMDAYEGVERVIRHLDGLPDVDHFIFLHTGDVHPWSTATFRYPSAAQMRLPLDQRLSAPRAHTPSPYLAPSAFNQASFWQGAHELDRALGMLFSYLEAHYAPDEYIVNLYSDHGVSIFSPRQDIASPHLTGATWMMRGAGVPEGPVTDELTSAVDIYPTLAKLAGFPVGENVDGVLPQAFGGPGRDIAYSNSLFPGKGYYLAARAAAHVLRLRVADAVEPDGTVDLGRADVKIYPRAHENEDGCETDSAALRAFFYPRVREFLRGIDNNGEVFPLPRRT